MLERGKIMFVALLIGLMVFGEIGIHTVYPATTVQTEAASGNRVRGDRALGMSDRAEIERCRDESARRQQEWLAANELDENL